MMTDTFYNLCSVFFFLDEDDYASDYSDDYHSQGGCCS